IDEPADQRATYLRTYAMEMRAAGVNFCYPVHESEENSWVDTLSNGTPLIEVIKQLADFLNAYHDIYSNVVVSELEGNVRVNGIVPFNGEWNLSGPRIDSPVNESKVTIAYTDKIDAPYSYLHIINHNWDSTYHTMSPQFDIPVEIPVRDSCVSIMIISSDFSDTVYPRFTSDDTLVNLVVPRLEYYDVIILSFADTTTIAESPTQIPSKIYIHTYPNPFNSSVRIELTYGNCKMQNENCKVQIYNLKGQEVVELSGSKTVIWTPRENLPAGVYFVRTTIDKQVVNKHIIYLK
ncbi:MAG: hypothetical protein DRZ76_02870, partial [Candidatus Nealsonbacteria bacterium]